VRGLCVSCVGRGASSAWLVCLVCRARSEQCVACVFRVSGEERAARGLCVSCRESILRWLWRVFPCSSSACTCPHWHCECVYMPQYALKICIVHIKQYENQQN
jgi:hypothetical protein